MTIPPEVFTMAFLLYNLSNRLCYTVNFIWTVKCGDNKTDPRAAAVIAGAQDRFDAGALQSLVHRSGRVS